MKVTYRGVRKEQPQKLQEKLDAKFGKLSKLLEKRGEKEAHVILTAERHLQHAEITLQYYDHQLVGIGSDRDQFTAICTAVDTLEKQAVKHRGKWREKARRGSNGTGAPVSLRSAKQKEAVVAEPAGKPVVGRTPVGRTLVSRTPDRRVNRVNHVNRQKPMTLDEAMMEMEAGGEYLVYQDADRDCLSVLVRRKDGQFDLIES